MSDNRSLRVPHMTQATARVCHEAGHPPPEGLVFNEVLGGYVAVDPDQLEGN